MIVAGLSNSNLAPTQNLTGKHKRALYIYFGQDKTPQVSVQTCGIDLNTQQYYDLVIKPARFYSVGIPQVLSTVY
jgi:hypothetical protein